MTLPSSVVPGHVVGAPVAGSLPTAKLVSEVALLQRRLAGRAVIEHAKGMLMERLGCTAVEAFEVLTLQSRLASHRARAEPPDVGAGRAATSMTLDAEGASTGGSADRHYIRGNHLPRRGCPPAPAPVVRRLIHHRRKTLWHPNEGRGTTITALPQTPAQSEVAAR